MEMGFSLSMDCEKRIEIIDEEIREIKLQSIIYLSII